MDRYFNKRNQTNHTISGGDVICLIVRIRRTRLWIGTSFIQVKSLLTYRQLQQYDHQTIITRVINVIIQFSNKLDSHTDVVLNSRMLELLTR
ncbi:uncharacterized protein Smp_201540 [Schistosoma mansoni]|uniref:uncharacterized protein n=1 Tax=Schistosoma mansoni TaxID=6183 RepID=UPI00022DC3FB|nr:uncharacterized protein Smp_201540 [Schistosoma mansoni]|eukprot:XP_018650223.1 uncharacterized protein Smp_201540 [Schistosoma mansoni]